jgi:hypothetical protein
MKGYKTPFDASFFTQRSMAEILPPLNPDHLQPNFFAGN